MVEECAIDRGIEIAALWTVLRILCLMERDWSADTVRERSTYDIYTSTLFCCLLMCIGLDVEEHVFRCGGIFSSGMVQFMTCAGIRE